MFVSAEYEASAFPTAEWRSTFAGAMHGGSTVLPVRFDDTELPGLPTNTGYLSVARVSPDELATKVARQLELAGVPLRRPTPATLIAVPRPARTSNFVLELAAPDGQVLAGAEATLVADNGNADALQHVG